MYSGLSKLMEGSINSVYNKKLIVGGEFDRIRDAGNTSSHVCDYGFNS